MGIQPDNHAPSVTLGAQHLIAMCRKTMVRRTALDRFHYRFHRSPNAQRTTRPSDLEVRPYITAGAEMTAMQRLDLHPLGKART
jgi:hypothetical protein